MFGFPLRVRHAVNQLARALVGELRAALESLGAVPLRQAIAAKASEIHQIDILHVAALAKVPNQFAKHSRLDFGPRRIIHGNEITMRQSPASARTRKPTPKPRTAP